MSESTAESLVRRVRLGVRAASTIPTPIDPTLTIQGEAADAKATGDAIAAVFNGVTVNGQSATGKAFIVYAGQIYMSSAEGAQTVAAAIEAAGDKDASEILYDPENLVTVAAALDDINDALESELSETQIDDIFDSVFGGDE